MFKTYRCLILALCLPAAGLAAETFSTPITGYIADLSSATLRAVLGVPGGLSLSDPLPLPDGTTRVRVAPGRDLAWVERGDSPPVVLLLKQGLIDRLIPVDGALSAADWIAFSPAASSAVLYSAASNRLQVLTGLPDSPRVVRLVDTTLLPQQPLQAAVSDDGKILITASETAIYLVTSGGTANLLLAGQKIHALTMLPNSTGVAAADSAAGLVYLLQNLGSTPVSSILASGLAGAEYISATWDGRTILTAQPDAKAVSMIDIESGEMQSFGLDTSPESLQPMSNRDVFLTSSRPGEAGWIFYRTARTGHPMFIPAVQLAEMQQ